jgi:selenocysteine-specific elongation factor
MLTVQLKLLDRVNKPLKDRTRIRFHLGTADLLGNVRLIHASELQPGESGFAQIFLNEPTVAVWNQPFVIRRQSPVMTIGGGRVLHPNAFRIRKPTPDEMGLLRQLGSTDSGARAAAAVYFSNSRPWQPAEWARSAGIADVESTYHSLLANGELVQVPISTTRHATIHRQQLEMLSLRILRSLTRLHEQHPLRFTHARSMLETEFSYLPQPELLNIAIEHLKQQKQIVANVNSIGLTGFGPKLSKGQKLLLEKLVAEFKTKGLKAPSVSELESGAKKNKDSVAELLDLAVENGELVRVASDLYLHVDTLDTVMSQLTEALTDRNELTMSEIRTVIDTSRKYSVPLCEYLDRIGFTKRVDDHRVLNKISNATES